MTKVPDNLDGMDQWAVLSSQNDPIRTDLLHNIDDKEQTWAVRVRNMKLIYGNGGATKSWQKWYPPVGKDFEFLKYDVSQVDEYKDSTVHRLAEKNAQKHAGGGKNYENPAPAPAAMFDTDLVAILRSMGREIQGKPFVVECSDIPKNASSNCQVDKKPCLYDVEKDPCEFYNLADQYPEKVAELLDRMRDYNSTAVPPHSDPVDQAGLPINHGGLWVPWVKLSYP